MTYPDQHTPISPRDNTKLLIARQIAVSQGMNWSKTHWKTRGVYLTLAESILATVERGMKDWRWS